MSRKSEIKKAIKLGEEEIANIERKRLRSQSALLDSIVMDKPMNDSDKEYYKLYTQLIEVERENVRKLKAELEKLD